MQGQPDQLRHKLRGYTSHIFHVRTGHFTVSVSTRHATCSFSTPNTSATGRNSFSVPACVLPGDDVGLIFSVLPVGGGRFLEEGQRWRAGFGGGAQSQSGDDGNGETVLRYWYRGMMQVKQRFAGITISFPDDHTRVHEYPGTRVHEYPGTRVHVYREKGAFTGTRIRS
eukprot:724048-Rhodomonas_salina.1